MNNEKYGEAMLKTKKPPLSIAMHILSFILPACLLLTAYAIFGIYPFGNKSLLITDMSQIYVDFHSWIYDVLTGKDGLFFTWRAGMGMNMTGVVAFYLASPFSFLVLIFGKANITEAILFITILKVACCGLTFHIYAGRVLKCNGISGLFFSVMYALMSYVVVYALNIMWLDGVILLPIILLSLHIQLERGKMMPLVASLTVMFIAQFYIAYMIGLFTVFYFLAAYLTGAPEQRTQFFKKAGRFLLSAALAAGIACFLLLPTYLSLKYVNQYILTTNSGAVTLGPFQFLSKALYDSYDTITYGLPNIYCGMLALLLLPLYFVNTGISRREKICSAGVLAVLLVSMTFWPLNLIWHGGDEPTWFPYRFSFLFSFYVLVLAVKSYQHREGLSRKQILSVFGVLTVLISLLQAFKYSFVSTDVIAASIILLGVYTILLLLMKDYRQLAPIMGILLFMAVCTEAFGNTQFQIQRMNSQFGYTMRDSYAGFEEFTGEAVAEVKSRDPGFYRIENHNMRNSNDALSLGYYGLTHYSSFTNQNTMCFMSALGLSTTTQNRFVRYFGATSVTDSLLGVKYVLGSDERRWGFERTETLINGSELYENKNALPVGYMVSGDTASLGIDAYTDDPFAMQNSLLELMNGAPSPYYEQIQDVALSGSQSVLLENLNTGWYRVSKPSGSKGTAEFSVVNPKDQQVLFYLKEKGFSDTTPIYVNGEQIGGGEGRSDILGAIDLGWHAAGETLTVQIDLTKDNASIRSPLFYGFDTTAFGQLCGKLRAHSLYDVTWGSNWLSGTVDAANGGLLFTSIPYDPGFEVRVDGKTVKPSVIGMAFIGVPINGGTHTVEFRFVPQGLRPGVWVSALSLLAAGFVIWNSDFKKGPARRKFTCKKRKQNV